MNEDFEKWWEENGNGWPGKRWARAAWEDRQAEIDALKAENEQLRKDAELSRLRYLHQVYRSE